MVYNGANRRPAVEDIVVVSIREERKGGNEWFSRRCQQRVFVKAGNAAFVVNLPPLIADMLDEWIENIRVLAVVREGVVEWPLAIVQDGSPSTIKGATKGREGNVVDGIVRVAYIYLDGIHLPVCELLGVLLKMTVKARIPGACLRPNITVQAEQ